MGLSQERLAEAMGVDSSTVARWERGETEPLAVHRPRLAAALQVSVEQVGELLTGSDPGRTAPAYLVPYGLAELPPGATGERAAPRHAWAALRTVEDLATFVRSDMLTRRDLFTASITMAAGAALSEPVVSRLAAAPGGLSAASGQAMGKIGMSTVASIEQGLRQLRALDAALGGGAVREAAVGQLKYAVDLAQYASYGEAVGARLLTVIADLASRIGWMCHDAGMAGPAQRYFWYGLQAAHEAGTERAQIRVVNLLTHMGRQSQEAGDLAAAAQLNDLARGRVPDDPHRFNLVRATLASRQASVISGMGATHLPEVHRCVDRSFALHQQGVDDDERAPWLADYYPLSYDSEAELASEAASAYLRLARADARLAGRAQRHAEQAVAGRSERFARSRVFDQITLARIRLRAGEPEQANQDGQHAIELAAGVTESRRVRAHLTQLMREADQHPRQPAVRELRERLDLALAPSP